MGAGVVVREVRGLCRSMAGPGGRTQAGCTSPCEAPCPNTPSLGWVVVVVGGS